MTFDVLISNQDNITDFYEVGACTLRFNRLDQETAVTLVKIADQCGFTAVAFLYPDKE